MACEDRQLTQAQREAGYEQLRNAGVSQAVRPFSGSPTLPNLIDYVNRELFPAVKQTRGKVNDVYRQVTDNAPSANPLAYYFSTETANADPTTGRLRLDNATQESATTARISQTNARLKDVAAWLDVMAGSATAPLGTLTLFHIADPARFIRFDLDTMVDQGVYWDLGITPIESSHDNPFLDGDGIVVSFIPGVASSGATVPPGAITPIASDTFVGNISGGIAAPVAVPLADVDSASIVYDATSHTFQRAALTGGDISSSQNSNALTIDANAVTNAKIRQSVGVSVIGRASSTTGDVADIVALAGDRYLKSSAAGTVIGFFTPNIDDFPDIAHNRFIGNISGVTAPMSSNDLANLASDAAGGIGWNATTSHFELFNVVDNSVIANVSGGIAVPGPVQLATLAGTALTYDAGTKRFDLQSSASIIAVSVDDNLQRAALTGDVTAPQNDNATTIANNAVTDGKLRDSGALSVIGRSANSSGDPADISATAASGAVLRESGSVLGFGTIATAGLADGSVTNAKLANMAQSTIKGRAEGAGTGAPTDLTPTQVAAIIDGESITWTATQTFSGAVLWVDDHVESGALPLNITIGDTVNKLFINTSGDGEIQTVGGTTSAGRIVRVYILASGLKTIKHGGGAGSLQMPGGRDHVFGLGQSFTLIGNNPGSGWRVSDVPVEYTDKGDITVSSTGATWTIDNDVVSNAKLRDSGALSVIGRSANSSGDPADISATAASGAVLRESGSTLGFGTIATAGIADGAVTDAKLRDSAALSVIGRSANSSGDPADIVAANDGEVLRRSGTTLGFGTIATAGLADDSVTNAKLANMAQSTIKGRAEGAGTGDPTDLTAAQVAAIIDGVAITWTALQTFSGSVIWNSDQVESGTLPMNITLGDSVNKLFINTAGDGEIQTIGGTSTAGRIVKVYILQTGLKTFKHGSGTGAQRMFWPGNRDHVLGLRQSFELVGENAGTGWRVTDVPVEYTDKGDITVSSTGATWTIDNDVVSDAKLRNSAAVSVIGRAANSTGDPADIVAAANDRVLARSSDSVAFQLISNAMISDGTIALGKIAGISANTVIGNNTGSTTNPVEISVGTNTVLGRVGANIVAAQLATGQIADDAVTDAKLRDSAALSVIGRSANSTGSPADIAAANDGQVFRRSGTTLGFGLLTVDNLSDNAVDNTKLTNMAQSTIKGRPEGAGTGDPQDLTPTQVVSIIDGEIVTWTASHIHDGAVRFNDHVRFMSINTQGVSGGIDNAAIGTGNVVRFTGTDPVVSGMEPIADGHLVLLVNANASDTNIVSLLLESVSSNAANRFAGVGTSRIIRPHEMALAWYDGTTDRWRLLVRDDADL